MNADPDPGAAPVQVQGGDGGAPHVDAQHAVGVQVGEHNTQFIYVYQGTYSDGVAAPALRSVSGKVDSPYRGLSAFEEQDAPFFFGRRAAIGDVLKRMSSCVHGTGLLVVSGVSGAGKSSLLRAGVLPQIRGVGLAEAPEAAWWPRLLFTPGGAPLDVLAVQVAHLAGINADAVRGGLDDNPARFALTARQAALAQLSEPPGEPGGRPPGPPRKQRLLLVVDQFEQVFSQCQDEKQRQAFITALCAAAEGGTDQNPAALIVLGVRADFEARCADYSQLAAAIQGRYLVTSMSELELRMAIAEPAKMAGSSVDEDLVQVLLKEVSTRRPGSLAAVPGRTPVYGAGILPLLSHALDQAWRSRTGKALTLADYERTGGIEGAVAASAQHAYDSLTPAQQAAARQIFIRLTATTTDSVDTAERASRAELTGGRDPAQERNVEAALEAFASERLLTLAAGTVEISHEVLLTSWPLLRDTWLAETHGDRIVRARLHNATNEWDSRSRDPSYLYSGSLLEAATATEARISADPVRYPPLSQTERGFIRASENAQHRRVRRRQATIAFLVVLVVGFAAAAVAAFRNSQEAASERDAAVSGQLVAQSEELGDTNPVLAKQESLAAWQIDPDSPAARYAMLTAARLPGTGILTSDGASVNAVAYSPDGKILATGSGDGIARLWDVATHQQIGVPLGTFSHARLIESMAFSPDGKTLAVASKDGVVRLWDVATHQLIGTPLTGDASPIYSIAFSPHGDLLAAGHSDGIVQLWNVASGQQAGAPLAPHAGTVNSVAFSPDGTMLATDCYSASGRSTVQLWDVNSRQPIGGPLAEQALVSSVLGSLTVYHVAFSPDGTTLAGGGSDGLVQLWNVTSRKETGSLFTDGISTITSVAFSPDSELVAAGDGQGVAQMWDVASQQRIGIPLTADTRPIESMAFSPDGKTLATGSTDGTARLWDVNVDDNDPIGFVTAGTRPARSVAFSPDGKILATGDYDDTARLWDAATQQELGRPLVGDHAEVMAEAFGPDGKILATASHDGTVRLWDVATGRQVGATLVGHAGALWSMAFSPDGKTLATGTGDATVQLWDVATGRQTGTLRAASAVNSVAFSPDGTMLVAGSSGGTTQLWDLATGRQIGVFSTGQTWSIFSVAFSPDGKVLATGSTDQTARLWDAATHQQIGGPLSGATNWVTSVAFSPDGQTLATGSDDGMVRLWDVATGQQIGLALASGDDDDVYSVAFSPDGNVLAAGYSNGVVQLWNVRYLTNAVPFLCASVGGSFTPAEWKRYVKGPAYQKTCS